MISNEDLSMLDELGVHELTINYKSFKTSFIVVISSEEINSHTITTFNDIYNVIKDTENTVKSFDDWLNDIDSRLDSNSELEIRIRGFIIEYLSDDEVFEELVSLEYFLRYDQIDEISMPTIFVDSQENAYVSFSNYAIFNFNKIEVYHYVIYENPFIGSTEEYYVKHNGSIEKPVIEEVEGFIFTGWTDVLLDDQKEIDYQKIKRNLYLVAFYEPIFLTVNFYDNDDNLLLTQEVMYGENAIIPDIPVIEGKVFLNWDKEVTQIKEDLEVRPVYKDKSLTTISFVTNGGTDVLPIEAYEESDVTPPENPTKTGHTFVGWYKELELVNPYIFTKMPKEDITLYAKWQINQYTIVFNETGETIIEDIIKDYNENIDLI